MRLEITRLPWTELGRSPEQWAETAGLEILGVGSVNNCVVIEEE